MEAIATEQHFDGKLTTFKLRSLTARNTSALSGFGNKKQFLTFGKQHISHLPPTCDIPLHVVFMSIQ